MNTALFTLAIAGSPHALNWQAGWWLLLASFASGAILGLFFHKPEFMGGYHSFRRRLARLGHIAFAALGMLNMIFGLSPWPGGQAGTVASWALVAGGVLMPVVCFLTAWREPFRHLFFLPVVLLILAAVIVAVSGGAS